MRTKVIAGISGLAVSVVLVAWASGLPGQDKVEGPQASSSPLRDLFQGQKAASSAEIVFTAEEIRRMKADDTNVPARVEKSLHSLKVRKELIIQDFARQRQSLGNAEKERLAAIDAEIHQLQMMQPGLATPGRQTSSTEKKLEDVLARLEKIQNQLDLQGARRDAAEKAREEGPKLVMSVVMGRSS